MGDEGREKHYAVSDDFSNNSGDVYAENPCRF